jgi:hypothetical protein
VTLKTFAKNALVREAIMDLMKFGYVIIVFRLVMNAENNYLLLTTNVVEKVVVIFPMKRKKMMRNRIKIYDNFIFYSLFQLFKKDFIIYTYN